MALEAKVGSLQKELSVLRNQLAGKEDAYRAFATDECGLEQEPIEALIEKAHSAPQNAKRLQDIHEAYKAMVTKCKQVAEVEARFNAARGGSGKPALVKQGNIVWIQLLKKTADLRSSSALISGVGESGMSESCISIRPRHAGQTRRARASRNYQHHPCIANLDPTP